MNRPHITTGRTALGLAASALVVGFVVAGPASGHGNQPPAGAKSSHSAITPQIGHAQPAAGAKASHAPITPQIRQAQPPAGAKASHAPITPQ